MGKPQTTFKKRQKEMKRKEKQEKKLQRRLEKKAPLPEQTSEPVVEETPAKKEKPEMIELGSDAAKELLAKKLQKR
jgi:hypothetical protein